MQRSLMNMTAALILCLTAPTAAWALTPTETVKSRVDEALQGLGPSAGADVESRRAEIRRIADSLFDFTEMSRRALGRHWADRTAAERDEFVRLFGDLMARAYIGKMDRYAGEAIAYTGQRVTGDEATVQSEVITAKGSRVPVEYHLHRATDGWTAYDIFIEHVSLVGTYRSQFDRVIRTESFASLLERLREKDRVVEAR